MSQISVEYTTYDISHDLYMNTYTNFTVEAFLSAARTMGGEERNLAAIVVHHTVMISMKQMHLIDLDPGRETFLGYKVIVGDESLREGDIATSWLISPFRMAKLITKEDAI